jgi:hypothetical protein
MSTGEGISYMIRGSSQLDPKAIRAQLIEIGEKPIHYEE